MGFKYPKFQKDYEDEAKVTRKSQLRVLLGLLIVFLVIIASSKAAIVHMKSQKKTVTVTVMQAPTVKQEIKPPVSAVPSTPNAQTQSAPILQSEAMTGRIVTCIKDGKTEYRDSPCK